MPKRTRAASTAALPAGSPSRRALLTSGTAAALIASTAAALPGADPDTALLALRPRWLAIQARIDAIHDPRSPADQANYAAIKAAMPRVADATSMLDRERILQRRREMAAGLPEGIREPQEERQAREDHVAALCHEENELIAILVAEPARTLVGLAFKAEVFLVNEGWENDLSLSIAIDIASIGKAQAGAKVA